MITQNGVIQEHEAGKPPQPPSIKKRFRLSKAQLSGVPLILLIPILALIGLFDTHTQSTTASVGDLLLTVEYPSSVRYKQIETMSLSVRNLSAGAMPTVTVTLGNAYVNGFSNVTFTPEVDKVTLDGYVVNLAELQPQEVRQIQSQILIPGRGDAVGAD